MSLERYQRSFVFNRVPIIWPIVFADDCEGTIGYETSGTGADWSVSYGTTRPFQGNHNLELKTRVTAPAIGDLVRAQLKLWLPPTQFGRIQFAFRPYLNGALQYIYLSLLWYNGVRLNSAEIRLDTANETVAYRNAAGAWINIPDFTFNNHAWTWSFFDFYADFINNTYSYFTLNNRTVDLAGTPVLTVGDLTPPQLELGLAVETQAASQVGTNFAQILLTPESP